VEELQEWRDFSDNAFNIEEHIASESEATREG
jgi:hypothetical protein